MGFFSKIFKKGSKKVEEHEQLPKQIANTNENKPKVKKENILIYDGKKEKELLEKFHNQDTILNLHFACMDLANFYYRYRDLDNKYLEEAIKYSEADYRNIMEVRQAFIDFYMENYNAIKDIDKEVEFNLGIGRVPTFERLCSIYKNQGDYKKAIDVCKTAINYYQDFEPSMVEKFEKKKAFFLKSLNK